MKVGGYKMHSIKQCLNNVIRFSLTFINLILCILISINLVFLINIKLNKIEIPQYFKVSFFCIGNNLLYPDLMYNDFVLTRPIDSKDTTLIQDDFVVFYDKSSIFAGKVKSVNSNDDGTFDYSISVKNSPSKTINVDGKNIIGKVILKLSKFGWIIDITRTYSPYIVLLGFIVLSLIIFLIYKY